MTFPGGLAGPGPLPGPALGEYARARAAEARAESGSRSAKVLEGIDDERRVRRLRWRLRLARLFRRVR